MRKTTLVALLITFMPTTGRCDMFGGDLAFLAQLVANSLQQLAQLRSILQNGQDDLALLQEINAGINDSLGLAQTISPYLDPGLFREIRNVSDAISKLQTLYGQVVDSPDAQAQRNSDQVASEALTMGNAIFDYTKDIDRVGAEIEQFSHQASPGGAQKLTAQSLGVLLHVTNASLRAQAAGLKLQAQKLAQENKKEKDSTREYLAASNMLAETMKHSSPKFERPRF